jgi:PAS domain S-box-containing protein
MPEEDGGGGRERGTEAALAAALPRSEAALREFIDGCPDGTFIRKGPKIVHANRALLRLLQLELGDVIGKDPATAFTHPFHRALVLEHRAKAPDDSDYREFRWVRKDGEFVDVEVIGVTVKVEGEPVRVCLCRDTTERRRHQAKMVIAGRMASVGSLAAGLAHEINGPLSLLIGNLRLLTKEQGGAGEEHRQLVSGLLEGAEKMRRIVDGLKTFSRGEDARRERLDLARVVDTALDLAALEIRSRARLVKSFQPVGEVEANEPKLVHVVLNLLLNAAEAIPTGRTDRNEIRVELLEEGGRAVIAVRDTGVGMPPERILRIFDPFYTTKPGAEGAGLGLSMCQNVVSALGGEILVDSRVGIGSTFKVCLPLAGQPAWARGAPPAPRRR